MENNLIIFGSVTLAMKSRNLLLKNNIKSDIETFINKLIKGKLSQKELLEFEKIISTLLSRVSL